MSSTGTYEGMNMDKPSSKVLAPPGGRTSINFGGWEDPAPPAAGSRPLSACQVERMRSSVFDDSEPPKRTHVPFVPVQPQQPVNACQAARMRSSVFAAFDETPQQPASVPAPQAAPENPPAPVQEPKPTPPPAAPEPTPVQPSAPVEPSKAPEPIPVATAPVPAAPAPAAPNPITSPILPSDKPIGIATPQPRSVRVIKPPGGASSITLG